MTVDGSPSECQLVIVCSKAVDSVLSLPQGGHLPGKSGKLVEFEHG